MKKKRKDRLEMTLTAQERGAIRKAAKLRAQTETGFARTATLTEARAVVVEATMFNKGKPLA